MPTSPLTAAMMMSGGGDGSAFGMDPNVMAAMPDIQLGQSLEQGGLSTAPAAPMQALARVVQAAAGNYLKTSAMSDLGKAYANSADSMAQIFPSGTPIGDGLRSKNPMVRMAAMQQAPKAMLQGNEPYTMEPGGQRFTGNQPLAQNTAPQSPEGKVAADQQHAATGNPAAVTPLGSVLTKLGSNDATGVPYPPSGVAAPQTNVPSGPPRIAPPPAQGGIGASPTAAIEPPQQAPQPTAAEMNAAKGQLATKLTDVAQSGVTSPTPTGVQSMPAAIAAAKGMQAKAEEAGKADVEFGSFRNGQPGPTSGPGISEPMPTDHGTKIPPLNAQATIPSDPGVIKEKLPAWQKTVTGWSSSLAPAQLAQQRLTTIANAFKSIQTGTFTTQKADLAAALKGVGLDASGLLGDPAQAQVALHENYAETMTQLKAATSRFTQQEFKITSENKQHPNIQPEANLQMLAEDMGSLKQQTDIANDWNQASKNGWKDPQSYQTEFLKLNPLSGYVAQEKTAIGPLKGMQTAPSSAGPVASVHSPAEIHAEMVRRGLAQ